MKNYCPRPLWKPNWDCPCRKGLENYLSSIPESEIAVALKELMKGDVRNEATIVCMNLNGVPLNDWEFRVECATSYAEAAKFHWERVAYRLAGQG